MFVFSVGVLLAAVAAFLSYPFWAPKRTEGWRAPVDPARDEEKIDLEIERETLHSSLAELETDLAQGRLIRRDFDRLKGTHERRLLEVLDRLEFLKKGDVPAAKGKVHHPKKPSSAAPSLLYRLYSIVLVLLVVGGASGIYRFIHWREEERVFSQRQTGQGMPDPREMVARLETRLRENPNDVQGQMMAGRSYMALGRIEEAKAAWSKVIELDRRNHEAHFNLGVILLQTPTEESQVFEEALRHLDIALVNVPDEPAVLWYKGIALVHLKRFGEADQAWTTAFQNLDPGGEDAAIVKGALQNLRSGAPPQF